MTIKNKAELVGYITEYIVSNTERRVTPEDIRTAMLDLIDSIHILTSDENILSNNLSSATTNNTSVGDSAMPNVIGDSNTAVGDSSLHCNLFGDNNTAIGAYSLENNVSGDANTAIGTGSLLKLKRGNSNIGIGNYAGYYIGENDQNQLFVGSHNIDSNFISTNPSGHPSIIPLLRGDLSLLRLGVGTNVLHNGGALQVNGNVTPTSGNNTATLGTQTYVWDKAFIGELDSDSSISINKTLLPGGVVNIGASGDEFNNLHVKNLFVTNSGTINHITNTSSINSYNKKIFLSTSGIDPLSNTSKPILTDEGIDKGGFYILSSGTGYNREYGFYYTKPDLALQNVTNNAFARSHWHSDISLSTDPGNHIITEAIIGRDNLELSNGDNNWVFIGGNSILAGDRSLGDINAITNEISFNNYAVSAISCITEPSGEDNNYSFFKALINEKRSISLFVIDSESDNSSNVGILQCLDISNDNNVSLVIHPSGERTILTNNYVGFQDCFFNTSTDEDSRIRFSGLTSSIQLSALDNEMSNGFEIKSDEFKTVGSLYYVGTKVDSFILKSGELKIESPLKLKVTSIPSGEAGYGTIFVRPSGTMSQETLFFRDSSGSIFDLLSPTQPNIFDPAFVYYDNNRNTLVGKQSGRDDYVGLETIIIGENDLLNTIIEEMNILIGNDLAGSYDIGRLLIGFGSGDGLFIDGKIPDGNNLGYIKIPDQLVIRGIGTGSSGYSTSILQHDNSNSYLILKRENYSDFNLLKFHNVTSFLAPPSFSHVFEDDIPAMSLIGNLNLHGDIRFTDGTSIKTANGIPTIAGNGISLDYNDFTKLTTISFNISDMQIDNENNDFGYNSNIIVETNGETKRTPISQLAQFVNHTNPQLIHECPVGYNSVISNNTNIDHSKNCNTVYIGNQAGDSSEWITNGVMIGPQAGKDATMSNTNLDIDISLIAIGHRAGKNSLNSDNSVFIGQSAGQDSNCANDSIFIGNSAGQSAKTSNSIGLGDNALENVTGSNNLEILPDKDFGKLINGNISNKANIAGILAGDICAGRVSVGGASRVSPSAAFEVCAKSDDTTVHLQDWYNSNGDLVAYLDQNGNLILKGVVTDEQSLIGRNTNPAIIPANLLCGNRNTGGSLSPILPISLGGNTSSELLSYAPQGYMLNYTMIYQEE